MLGKALPGFLLLGQAALHFTFQKSGGGTEARKDGTSLCFPSCIPMGMTVSPYGVFVDEMQEGGNPRQTLGWPPWCGSAP